jgi:hypothetical protein
MKPKQDIKNIEAAIRQANISASFKTGVHGLNAQKRSQLSFLISLAAKRTQAFNYHGRFPSFPRRNLTLDHPRLPMQWHVSVLHPKFGSFRLTRLWTLRPRPQTQDESFG